MTHERPYGVTTSKRGRPPKPALDRAQTTAVRLTPAQRDKLALLGGAAWLRAQIDAADLAAPLKQRRR